MPNEPLPKSLVVDREKPGIFNFKPHENLLRMKQSEGLSRKRVRRGVSFPRLLDQGPYLLFEDEDDVVFDLGMVGI